MLIKLGGQWYRLEGFSLVAAETPETEPADGEFIDGDALAGDLDSLDIEPARERVAEIRSEFETARAKAQETGNREQLDAATGQIAGLAIASHILLGRESDLAALGADLPEGLPETNAGAEGEGNTPETPETPVAPGEPIAEGAAPEGGTPEGGDPAVTPEAVTPEAVLAAAALMANAGGINADALSNASASNVTNQTPAPRRQVATIRAAAAAPGSEGITDEQIGQHLGEASRNLAGGTAGRIPIARIESFGPQVETVTAGAAQGGVASMSPIFNRARQIMRMGETERAEVIQAAASLDTTACTIADQRREIDDCGDLSRGPLDIFETYPAPHCVLEYYVNDTSIADVANGITTWDTVKADAYAAARATYLAAIAADPAVPDDITAAFAALKAAEKQCAAPKCIDRQRVTWTPIVACSEWPESLEYCSPETVRLFRRTLQRAFIREQVKATIAYLASTAITVDVDATAAPFANVDGEQLDAAHVIDHVISVLMPQGVTAERVTEGNYVAILPYGLSMLLDMSSRKAEQTRQIAEILGVRRIETIDLGTGVDTAYPTLPAAGSVNDFANLREPKDWEILVLDPDDYFMVQRPDIEIGAQMTPESARGNYVFGGFQETFQGYGKDGCHPTWHIRFSGLCFNGAHVAAISPNGMC